MIERSKEKKHWIIVTQETIAEINPKLSVENIDNDLLVSFIPMASVQEKSGIFDSTNIRKYSQVKKGYTSFIDNDIIFAKITPCMENGKIALLSNLKSTIGFGSTEFHVARSSNAVYPKYLFYFLNQEIIRKDARRQMTGSAGQLRVPTEYFKKIPIPLPPLPEQRAIVAKIEQLFSELDNGVESLKTVKAQLKVYRQAVYKACLEGNYLKKNTTWSSYKLSELCKTIDGDRGPNYPKKEDYLKSGYCLYLSTKNVRPYGFLFNENVFINKEKHDQLRNGTLTKGDLVITTRGTLGNVAIYDESVQHEIVRINSGMLIIRPFSEEVNRRFLMHYLISPLFTLQIKKNQSGTAQPQIPANVLKELKLKLPDNNAQEKIVSEIESRLSVCDNLEKTIDEALARSEALRQSILKKAFEGRLLSEAELEVTRQESDWEPAEKLLERIKAEKTATAAKQKPKRKKHG